MSNFHKMIGKQIKKEFIPLLEATLRSGANNIGNQLLEAVSDVSQPTDIVYSKITTALKDGAIATGQEIIMVGIDRIRAAN